MWEWRLSPQASPASNIQRCNSLIQYLCPNQACVSHYVHLPLFTNHYMPSVYCRRNQIHTSNGRADQLCLLIGKWIPQGDQDWWKSPLLHYAGSLSTFYATVCLRQLQRISGGYENSGDLWRNEEFLALVDVYNLEGVCHAITGQDNTSHSTPGPTSDFWLIPPIGHTSLSQVNLNSQPRLLDRWGAQCW